MTLPIATAHDDAEPEFVEEPEFLEEPEFVAEAVEDDQAPSWYETVPVAGLVLALVLWATLVLKIRNLEHTDLKRWDEVFHAVVAQNVLKHPLQPTLVDVPYLP